MAMNTSGAISLAGSTAGVSIAQQLGLGATTQISLNDSAVRTLAGVPSGAIVMPTNFYGKSNTVTINLTIASNTKNYNIFSNKGGSYVAGKSIINLTVNSGIVVGSTSTSTYAMDTGSGWATGDVINITNNGYIAGKGGNGGAGHFGASGDSGVAGGAAINLQWNIATFTNSSGYIYSGGGGGGAGAPASGGRQRGYGGGGGGGSSIGAGGIGTQNGGNGTNHGHGGGGAPLPPYGGGAGGSLGNYGGWGTPNIGGEGSAGAGGGGGGGGATGGPGGSSQSNGVAGSGGGHGKGINLNAHTINGTTTLTRTYGGIS